MAFNRRKQKVIWLVVIAVVIITLLGLLIFRHHNNKNQSSNITKTNFVAIAPSGMKYPTGWQEASQIDFIDQQAGVISEAFRANPDAKVLMRVDNAALAKGDNIKAIPVTIVSKLKSSLTGFVLIQDSVLTLGRNQAVSITYKDLSGSVVYEHTQLIIPTKTKSYYLTVYSKLSDYSQIEGDINKIGDAFTNYVSTHP